MIAKEFFFQNTNDLIFRELTPTDIKIIAYDIAQGMEYLHKLRPVPVIHRDLNRYATTLLDFSRKHEIFDI